MKIMADLHTHTRYSHGKGTVTDNVTAALAKGFRAIGITDHGPRSAPWVGASVRDFKAMRREVTEVDARSVGIKVLAGAECNVASARGDLDVPLSIRRELDIVLAGLHPGILPKSGRDWLVLTGGNWMAKLNPGLRRRARTNNTKAIVEAVLRNDIDVVTHPGYHLDIDTTALARACSVRETAMEINARHHEMTVEFCRAATREGAKFVIDSDAHDPKDVGNLARGLAVAKAAGLTAQQVLNAEGGDLFGWLERKKGRRVGSGAGWRDWVEQPGLEQVEQRERRSVAKKEQSGWADWAEQGKRVH